MKLGKRYKVNTGAVIASSIVAGLILLAGFTFLCGRSFTDDASPEIYIHTDETVVMDITVRIEDGVTRTIPEAPMGKEATWKGVTVDPEGWLEYEGDRCPFLYYEGVFIDRYPEINEGWVIKDTGDGYLVNGHETDGTDLTSVLMSIFEGTGLTSKESKVLILRARSIGVFEDQKNIILGYMNEEIVDEIIEIETSIPCVMMRRHFLIDLEEDVYALKEPEFNDIPIGPLVIHETALNLAP